MSYAIEHHDLSDWFTLLMLAKRGGMTTLTMELPESAQLLGVHSDYDKPVLACLVTLSGPVRIVKRALTVAAAGATIDSDFPQRYLGSLKLEERVLHVFAREHGVRGSVRVDDLASVP